MSFDKWIGQTFLEAELYESVLFQMEENFEQYLGQRLHLYFKRGNCGKVQVSGLAEFESDSAIYRENRRLIGKQEWIEIDARWDHINVLLCRLDRTGTLSSVHRDFTRSQDWMRSWVDELPSQEPMTPLEIQDAFRELAVYTERFHATTKLRSKKTI